MAAHLRKSCDLFMLPNMASLAIVDWEAQVTDGKYFVFCSQTTVCNITRHPDFTETGKWEVVTETEGRYNRAVFDAVLVCTGNFLNPHLPLESFPGELQLPETMLTLLVLKMVILPNFEQCIRMSQHGRRFQQYFIVTSLQAPAQP